MELTFHNSSYVIFPLSDLVNTMQLLTQSLLKQGYDTPRLKSSLPHFYGWHSNRVIRYEISLFQITMNFFLFRRFRFSFIYHRYNFAGLDNMSPTADFLYEAATAYFIRVHGFTPIYWWIFVLLIFLVSVLLLCCCFFFANIAPVFK
jgi:hypothetical protein